MAFCSEMPFICSKTLRGLETVLNCAFFRLDGRFVADSRVCYGLDSIESTIDDELDVSSGEPGNTLYQRSVSPAIQAFVMPYLQH